MQKASLIGVPIYTLAKYRGMSMAVRALRELGLADALRQRSDSFTDFGDVALPQIEVDSGPSNLRNFSHFLRSTDIVIEATRKIPRDDFVFCIGGECGLVLGTLAAFKSNFRGQPGILWMDAHGDFNTPETTPSGFIGGMPLALACGRGPKLSPVIESSRPLVMEEQVVHLGNRELDRLESQTVEASPMRVFSATEVHKGSIDKISGGAAAYLADSADWIICHLDVDVIDPSILPSVNFPSKGGLMPNEVKTIVEALWRTEKLKVFNLTAYDPTLDKTKTSGITILKLISDIFP